MITAAILLPYTLLTQGIYSGIIHTIGNVTTSICDVVLTIYNHQNINVNNKIKHFDINRRLILIRSVLRTMNNTSNTLSDMERTHIHDLIHSRTHLEKDPIELCLTFLNETIHDIYKTLREIDQKVAYHHTKWFVYWRTLNIDALLEQLETQIVILEKIFHDLTRIGIFLSHCGKMHHQ